MKKTLLIIGMLLLVVLVAGGIYIELSLPSLPAGTEDIIQQVQKSDLPALRGEQGYAQNGEVQIWYESISPKDSVKGTLLLIMGISNDALAWPRYFIDPLVEAGYRVVRYDNRGTGMTDWMEDWTAETAYSLEDIALDGIAVLDELNVDQAHIIGVSMGGMIAQALAIQHPDRALSLTSMMSTGDIVDPELSPINTALIKDLILAQVKYGILKTETNQVRMQILARQLLQGDTKHELDIEGIAQTILYNVRKRNGYYSKASQQHSAATLKSGSRHEALAQLITPTLIIHGMSDPLIRFEHGEKCYEVIPGAKKLWLEGMGHDIPKAYVGEVVEGIIQHITSVEN